jgi:hypothetical protein
MSLTYHTDRVEGVRWLRTRWNSSFFGGAAAQDLGLHRLLFYNVVIYFFASRPSDVARWAEVSDVFWAPTSFFRLLHLPVFPATALSVALWIWRTSLLLALVGLFTRLSTVLAFILGFYLLGLPHDFGKVNHNDAVVVVGLAIFAFSRCGDAWSLDGLRRARPNVVSESQLSGKYSWPLGLYRLMLALVLFSPGVAKLRGPGFGAWALSNNLYNTLVAHQYTHAPPTGIGLLLVRSPWTCQVLAAGAPMLELSTPLLVLLPVRARTFFAGSVVAMLLGFWLMMGVFFKELIVLLVLFFFPWRDVAAWLLDRVAIPRLAVLYDGSCGLCKRTIATLRALDVFGCVDMWDVLADWPRVSARWPTLNQKVCLEDMHVATERGRIYTGFYAYRALA